MSDSARDPCKPAPEICPWVVRVLSIALMAGTISGCAAARLSLEHEPLSPAMAAPQATPSLAARLPSRATPVDERGMDQAPVAVETQRDINLASSTSENVKSFQAGDLAAPNHDSKVARTAAVAGTPKAGKSAEMTPVVPPPGGSYPIDLPTALRLAESINPVIGEARARVGEALGRQLTARTLLLPTLNAGTNYHGHAGVLQRSSGQILNVSSQSLYFGGGTRALASGTVEVPAVNIVTPLTEALFEPLAARQQVDASRFDASATANTVLLGVALDYVELHGAMAALQARHQTEAEAAEVARITTAYAQTGEGRQADADRAATEWKLRRADVRAAEERLAVASARLVRRLHLDQTVRIDPAGDPLEIFTLVDPDTPTEDLLATALRQRPEIHARSAEIGVAEQRLRKERARPFLPTLWLGFSGAAFGGGSNLVPPFVGMFRGRTDYDVQLYWSLLNLGMGNLSLQKQRQTQVGQADASRARVINQVREEVVAARSDVLAWRERIALAMQELASSHEGFLKDLDRVRGAAAPPLEVLDNLRLLRQARETFIASVVGYNQAQFRLFVAMGSPPPLIGPTEPTPPADTAATLVASSAPAPPTPASGPIAPHTASGTPPAKPAESSKRDVAATHAAAARTQEPARPETGAEPNSGPLQQGLASLSRARQDALKAMSDYDREQARLMESLAKDGSNLDRGELLQRLMTLAEAHRGEMNTRVEYDRAIWQLFTTIGNAPASPELTPSPVKATP